MVGQGLSTVLRKFLTACRKVEMVQLMKLPMITAPLQAPHVIGLLQHPIEGAARITDACMSLA